MSAKEMFDKLGYEYTKMNDLINYKKRLINSESNIYIDSEIKIFWKEDDNGNGIAFTSEELKAVHQQIKELSCNE